MLESKDFPFQRQLFKLLQMQRFVLIRFKFASERHEAAIVGFQALGSLANAAIPRLTQLFDRPDTAADSLRILCDLGDLAIPSLVQATTNVDPVVRGAAIVDLGYRHQPLPAVVQSILNGLKDPDASVRRAAADMANRFQTRADVFVPALIDALDDTDTFV
jgi:HEAT repeat protein